MQKFSLEALGHQLLERAGAAGGGHTADTVVGGHERILRQTVIAMLKGAVLAEHENPGEATVHVLRGRVRLSAGKLSWEGRSGDLLVVPDARHSLEALEAFGCTADRRQAAVTASPVQQAVLLSEVPDTIRAEHGGLDRS